MQPDRPTRRRAAGLALAIALALGACSGDDGDDAITVGAVLAPTNLDLVTQAGAALDQVLLDNVYETLLMANDDGQVEAGLTQVPEISDDGLTYTFTIPEGVTFHSGEPLTGADVVWS
ncbi:MAG: ABC transporter substrate-binding protein, partial [Ilumatobacteraceae bacterium]